MISDWQKVPASAVPDGCEADSLVYNTYAMYAPSPVKASKSAKALKFALPQLANTRNLAIEISSTINSGRNVYAWGLTQRMTQKRNGKVEYGGSLISLSTEMILPLLMQDLTVSERLVQHFGVAKTVKFHDH